MPSAALAPAESVSTSVSLSASITPNVVPLRFWLAAAAGAVLLQGVKDLRGEAAAGRVPLQEVRDL